MILRALALHFDARRKRDVAHGRLPYEAECIACPPHVVAAGTDRVGAGRVFVGGFGGATDRADVTHVDERADRTQARPRGLG